MNISKDGDSTSSLALVGPGVSHHLRDDKVFCPFNWNFSRCNSRLLLPVLSPCAFKKSLPLCSLHCHL